MIGHEAQDGEDDKACVDTRGTVRDADDDAVPIGSGRVMSCHVMRSREKPWRERTQK